VDDLKGIMDDRGGGMCIEPYGRRAMVLSFLDGEDGGWVGCYVIIVYKRI